MYFSIEPSFCLSDEKLGRVLCVVIVLPHHTSQKEDIRRSILFENPLLHRISEFICWMVLDMLISSEEFSQPPCYC